MKDERGALTLVLDRPLPPRTRLEIWVDPQTQRWCIGPPRALTSSAVAWQQVDPPQFFQ